MRGEGSPPPKARAQCLAEELDLTCLTCFDLLDLLDLLDLHTVKRKWVGCVPTKTIALLLSDNKMSSWYIENIMLLYAGTSLHIAYRA